MLKDYIYRCPYCGTRREHFEKDLWPGKPTRDELSRPQQCPTCEGWVRIGMAGPRMEMTVREYAPVEGDLVGISRTGI